MHSLQVEHAQWLSVKYPDQDPKTPAVGCVEEAGELVHAVLKIHQVNTWGEDARHKLLELQRKLVDAIGDCGVYACSVCNANEWDFADLWDRAEPRKTTLNALDSSIELVQSACSVALHPDQPSMLAVYISTLKAVASKLGLNAQACVRIVWEEVKCR